MSAVTQINKKNYCELLLNPLTDTSKETRGNAWITLE